MLMLGVADDGAIYAGNLSVNNSTPFRLYRWSNDSTSSVPTIAFSGDPGLGNNQRWGDTLDVRGSGTNTQVLIASRLGNLVSLLTTTNGSNFMATPITIPAVANGMFGLSIAFGRSNTFWGKTTNNPLYHVSFNLTDNSGSVIRTIGDPSIPNMLVPIAISPGLELLAGIHWDTPDNVKLYDVAGTSTPSLLLVTNYATDVANTFFVGSVDFSRDRVYALNANNGIMALRLNFLPAAAPQITKVDPLANNRMGLWLNAARRPYIIEGSSDLLAWNTVWHEAPTDGYIEFTDSTTNAARYYRLIAP